MWCIYAHYLIKNCLALTSTTVNTLPSLQNSVKSIRTGTPSSKSSSGLPSMSFPVPGPLPLFDEFFCCSSSTRWAASAAFPLWLFAATSVSVITWRSEGRKKLLILANFPDAFLKKVWANYTFIFLWPWIFMR